MDRKILVAGLGVIIISLFVVIFFQFIRSGSYEAEIVEPVQRKQITRKPSREIKKEQTKREEFLPFPEQRNPMMPVKPPAQKQTPGSKKQQSAKKQVSVTSGLHTDLTVNTRDDRTDEMERMKEALPGNMFLPGLDDSDFEGPSAAIQDLVSLQQKVENSEATDEEKRRYYQFRSKMARDKISLINYFLSRSKELETSSGEAYFSPEDLEASQEALETNQALLDEFEYELSKLPEE